MAYTTEDVDSGGKQMNAYFYKTEAGDLEGPAILRGQAQPLPETMYFSHEISK